LNTINDWKIFSKSRDFPEDIPKAPQIVYKKEWNGVGDWLGTGSIASSKREFLPYIEARKFAHSLNIKSNSAWRQYSKSGKKPENIPSTPARTYKNKGWISEGDWLGTKTIATYYNQYCSFSEAKKFVHSLNLQNEKQWREFCKSGKKPKNIPTTPARTYNKEWKGLGDWFGTGRIANQNRNYMSFSRARKSARSLGIKNVDDWRKWCKSDLRPKNIPAHPHEVYKNEWIDYGDWLGSKNISNLVTSKNYLPFNEAREEVRKLAKKYDLKTQDDWKKAVKEGKIPKNIPLVPSRVYSKKRKK